MGTTITPHLLIGVPLTILGTVTKEKQELPVTDRLGRPTGDTVTLCTVKITLPNGQVFTIGSNEKHLLEDGYYYNDMEYDYSDLNDEDDYVFEIYPNAKPDHVFIGVEIGTKAMWGQEVGYRYTYSQEVKAAIDIVGIMLAKRYGYKLPVYVAAMQEYS